MQDFNALEGKSLAELREIGRALGVGNVMLKKKELLEQIRAGTLVAGQHSDTEPNAVPAEEPKRRGRRPRMSGVKVEGRSPAEGPEVPAETETTVAVAPVAEEQPVEAAAVPKRRGRKPKSAEEPAEPVAGTGAVAEQSVTEVAAPRVREERAEGEQTTTQAPKAMYAARIAVYDDMLSTPRVIVIDPQDVRTYLEETTNTVYQCMKEQGGHISLMVIREIVENFIHAHFAEPIISILDGGDTIRFADQGPGIDDKERAFDFGVTSANSKMKRYIRGTGAGFPMVQEYLENAFWG